VVPTFALTDRALYHKCGVTYEKVGQHGTPAPTFAVVDVLGGTSMERWSPRSPGRRELGPED
jgi:hypothetical protein